MSGFSGASRAGDQPRPISAGRRVLVWLGVVLVVCTGIFPYSASGLAAPWTGLVVLWAMWVALLFAAVRLARMGSLLSLLMAPLAIVIWFIVLSLGEAWLGWTG